MSSNHTEPMNQNEVHDKVHDKAHNKAHDKVQTDATPASSSHTGTVLPPLHGAPLVFLTLATALSTVSKRIVCSSRIR